MQRSAEPAVVRHAPDRLDVVDELDALFDRSVELVLARGDLVRSAPVDNLDVLAPGQALGDAAGVHRDVAGADDDHADGSSGRAPPLTRAEERDAVDDARIVDRASEPRPFAHHAPIVNSAASWRSFSSSRVTSRAERRVEMHGDPRAAGEHPVDVLVEDLWRAAERGDAPGHVAAEHPGQLVDVDRVARLREILRGGQAGRAAADDADRLRLRDRHGGRAMRRAELVHHVALQVADRERPVRVGAAAGRLARRVADPAADRRERVRRGDRLERLLDLPLPDVRDVGGRVGSDRAGDLTRRGDEVGVVDVVGQRELGGTAGVATRSGP